MGLDHILYVLNKFVFPNITIDILNDYNEEMEPKNIRESEAKLKKRR